MGGNQSINSLYLTGGGGVTFASGNTLTIGSGGIISNGATGTIAAGNNQPAITNVATLGATDAANTGAITTASGGDLIITTSSNLQINALLTGNVALTKSGAGLLDLSHQNASVPIANSYTGITTINAGVIKVNSDSNLGAAPGTFTANALTLNGGELRVATAFALASNRGITVGPQGGTLSYTDGSLLDAEPGHYGGGRRNDLCRSRLEYHGGRGQHHSPGECKPEPGQRLSGRNPFEDERAFGRRRTRRDPMGR